MAKSVNMHEAKTHLSRLVKAALEGEEVILTKAGKPQVRLVPVEEAQPALKKRRPFGMFRRPDGSSSLSDDFNDEMTDEELGGWYTKMGFPPK